MAANIIPCPACGAGGTRKLTRKELRASNGGQDPLVVTIPRTCPGCGHVWEPPLSRAACYAVAAVAGAGFFIGVVVFVVTLSALADPAPVLKKPANAARDRSVAIGFGLAGIALATGAAVMCEKYIRLARAGAPNAPPDPDPEAGEGVRGAAPDPPE